MSARFVVCLFIYHNNNQIYIVYVVVNDGLLLQVRYGSSTAFLLTTIFAINFTIFYEFHVNVQCLVSIRWQWL